MYYKLCFIGLTPDDEQIKEDIEPAKKELFFSNDSARSSKHTLQCTQFGVQK